MPRLDAIAPIIWAKWGSTFLEALRQECLRAADGLAFQAMNSEAGNRTLLIVCTTNLAQIQSIEEALQLNAVVSPTDWERYSVAEMVFKTKKGTGLGHREMRGESGTTALVLCATRREKIQMLEKLCDLPE